MICLSGLCDILDAFSRCRGIAPAVDTMLDDLIAAINRLLPESPYPQRVGFVQTAPWLALLSAALGLFLGGRIDSILLAVQLLARGQLPPILYLLFAVSPLLALASIPGLNGRRRWGWILFALSVLIDFVFSLITLQIFGLLFGAIFLYYLLQTYAEYGRRYYR